MANKNTFAVAIFGFSKLERILITNIFKLSQAHLQRVEDGRHFAYHLVDHDSPEVIDIILVDGDDSDSLDSIEQIHKDEISIPVISICKAGKDFSRPGEFLLERHRIGGLLLKFLDKVVEQWIQGTGKSRASQWIKTKRCLVVDDSQLVRTQMKFLLQEYQLDLCFAEDAETALRMIKQKTFDLTFLDVMLPEMDGYQACKLLKADPNTSATPIVMLTSKKSPFNKMHGALVGCDKYLTKPIDAEEVQQVLEQYNLIPLSTESTEMRESLSATN